MLRAGFPVLRVGMKRFMNIYEEPAAHSREKCIEALDTLEHELEFLRAHHAHRRLGLSEGQMAAWARGAGLDAEVLRIFPPTDTEGLTVCLWRLTPEEAQGKEQ